MAATWTSPSFAIMITTLMLITKTARASSSTPKPNVLFIGVDDLRPDLAGPFGENFVATPSLDRLASQGTTFLRAYCQISLCSPSRTALLTGLRPDTSKVWEIGPYFRKTMPNGTGEQVITLPQYFRMNGYWTTGAGKIFHPGPSSGGYGSSGGADGGWPFNASGSWSKPYFFCDQFYNGTFQSPAMQDWPEARAHDVGCIQSDACVACLTAAGSIGGKHSWKASPCNASCFPDGAVADEIVLQLATAKTKQPFFLAAGFKRPHLGWMGPTKYFDMYNISDVAIATHRTPPLGMPAVAFGTNGEMCGMDDVTCFTNVSHVPLLPDYRHAEMRRAYYSVVTFMDSQVGRVLDALDDNDLRSSTIVVFWGDHGYQLGEHGLWAKVTNFELATRVPLIISLPNQANAGTTTRGFASLIDVFPTLVDACGLQTNSANQGKSLLPLIRAPDDISTFNVSYSQFFRPGNVMGLSMRTDKFRFTRWGQFDYTYGRPDFVHGNVDYELYDHANDTEADFNAYENTNLAVNASSATIAHWDDLVKSSWDGGRLPGPPGPPPPPPPPPPHPMPKGKHVRFAAEGRGCLMVATADEDVNLDSNCSDTFSIWIPISQGSANPEIESIAFGLCLNVYGGMPNGCHAGAVLHLNECGKKPGNFIEFDNVTSTLKLSAATQCGQMCVGVSTTTAMPMTPRSQTRLHLTETEAEAETETETEMRTQQHKRRNTRKTKNRTRSTRVQKLKLKQNISRNI
eukprot:m.165590 g.165590  ORF g.165590 m.165590 type:complete len:742 (-) comp31389_c0_seq4:22-2247(-)